MPMSGGDHSTAVTASAGDRLALQCAVLRGGAPLTIAWSKDASPILASSSSSSGRGSGIRFINEFTSSLAIESLNAAHAGRYACSASNEAGRASVSVQVIVQGQSINRSRVLTAVDDDRCIVDKGPKSDG